MSNYEYDNEILEGNDLGPGNEPLPTFLNVLTILTFIGSGLAALMGLYNLTTYGDQKEQLDEALRVMGDSEFGRGFIEDTIILLDNHFLIQGTAIVVAIGCLIGAYLMRQQKKNGFYLYVVACIIGLAVPLSVVGVGVMGAAILVGSIFTIAFIIMYGVNLKYMR